MCGVLGGAGSRSPSPASTNHRPWFCPPSAALRRPPWLPARPSPLVRLPTPWTCRWAGSVQVPVSWQTGAPRGRSHESDCPAADGRAACARSRRRREYGLGLTGDRCSTRLVGHPVSTQAVADVMDTTGQLSPRVRLPRCSAEGRDCPLFGGRMGLISRSPGDLVNLGDVGTRTAALRSDRASNHRRAKARVRGEGQAPSENPELGWRRLTRSPLLAAAAQGGAIPRISLSTDGPRWAEARWR